MASTLLISSYSISKSYGNQVLFSDISLNFFSDERLGLIGPNGSGKSTLLKIFSGVELPDSGEITRKQSTFVVYLPQEDRFNLEKTVEETLQDAFPEGGLEVGYDQRTQEIIRQTGFADPTQKVGTLSGGWRKRLAISRALIQKPDLLLMDEPTNHLDMEGILWLEGILKLSSFAFVLASHDRYFLENTTNRIVEISQQYPEGFLKVEGNYSSFLQKREAAISQQEQQELVLANKVRRELEWLQQGSKARTSKARYRLNSAQQLQGELKVIKARNVQQGKAAKIDFEAIGRKTKKLLEAQNIGISRGGRALFAHLNLQLSPGKCVGVLGQNGSGKTTLIQLLRGELAPDLGTITWADGIRVVVFDQKREQLNPELTLKEALCPLGDRVVFREHSVHISAWAKRFLFPVEKLGLPISQLSGGEQARVLIANLMLQPADILLLDEPTNDLDIPTLEVLEESLQDFPGAIVLITHDRFLLDRLSDTLLYLDGRGKVEFFADYYQWLEARKPQPATKDFPNKLNSEKKASLKLSYEERKELNRIEQKIIKAEHIVDTFQQQLHDPEIMSDAGRLATLYAQLQKAENNVKQLYQRWEKLERLK